MRNNREQSITSEQIERGKRKLQPEKTECGKWKTQPESQWVKSGNKTNAGLHTETGIVQTEFTAMNTMAESREQSERGERKQRYGKRNKYNEEHSG